MLELLGMVGIALLVSFVVIAGFYSGWKLVEFIIGKNIL